MFNSCFKKFYLWRKAQVNTREERRTAFDAHTCRRTPPLPDICEACRCCRGWPPAATAARRKAPWVRWQGWQAAGLPCFKQVAVGGRGTGLLLLSTLSHFITQFTGRGGERDDLIPYRQRGCHVVRGTLLRDLQRIHFMYKCQIKMHNLHFIVTTEILTRRVNQCSKQVVRKYHL